MIFRWFLRKQSERRMKQLVLPGDYAKLVAGGHWNYISEMSEWRAFRHLFFPTSVLREADPKRLKELQQMIETILAETEDKKKVG